MSLNDPTLGGGPLDTIAARATTRTAVAPLLVLDLIYAVLMIPIGLGAAPTIALPMMYGFFGLIGFTLLAYGYFALTDPDRLQSEDHQLAQQRIRLLEGRKVTYLDGSGNLTPPPTLPPGGEHGDE